MANHVVTWNQMNKCNVQYVTCLLLYGDMLICWYTWFATCWYADMLIYWYADSVCTTWSLRIYDLTTLSSFYFEYSNQRIQKKILNSIKVDKNNGNKWDDKDKKVFMRQITFDVYNTRNTRTLISHIFAQRWINDNWGSSSP